jgi:hypothetical protein
MFQLSKSNNKHSVFKKIEIIIYLQMGVRTDKLVEWGCFYYSNDENHQMTKLHRYWQCFIKVCHKVGVPLNSHIHFIFVHLCSRNSTTKIWKSLVGRNKATQKLLCGGVSGRDSSICVAVPKAARTAMAQTAALITSYFLTYAALAACLSGFGPTLNCQHQPC